MQPQLEAHLRVRTQVLFGIEERHDDSVVGTSVDVTHHDVQVLERSLQPDPGQDVAARLVLVALPGGNVVVGEIGITVGPVEQQHGGTSLDVDA